MYYINCFMKYANKSSTFNINEKNEMTLIQNETNKIAYFDTAEEAFEKIAFGFSSDNQIETDDLIFSVMVEKTTILHTKNKNIRFEVHDLICNNINSIMGLSFTYQFRNIDGAPIESWFDVIREKIVKFKPLAIYHGNYDLRHLLTSESFYFEDGQKLFIMNENDLSMVRLLDNNNTSYFHYDLLNSI